MLTECCQATTAIQNNSEWCRGCGREIRSYCQWVVGYNNPNLRKAKYPVYSRTKRFKNYVVDMNKIELLSRFNDVLDVFGLIEFNWGTYGCPGRLYFFNKACVLYFIIQYLEIDCEIITLKDPERVKTQLKAMDIVLSKCRLF